SAIDARRKLVLAVAEILESRVLLANTLIPLTGAKDVVFDDTRNILYITTASGKVERLDVANRSLLSPWIVGSTLNGADITPDGSALYVADGTTSATQGFIRRVDLNTGNVSNL